MHGQVVYENKLLSVAKQGDVFVRTHTVLGQKRPFATSVFDFEKNEVVIEYLRQGKKHVNDVSKCFDYVGLEEVLINNWRFILHSSLISTPFGGVLFSGPSGIGKSTQADLWIQHQGARLINGDRSIFHKKENRWFAYGSPYAGSSRCFVNEGIPVAAIVVLKQGETCQLERLNDAEAFRYLYSETTVNVWNSGFVQRVCNLVENVVAQVPVYQFTCTPNKKAVDILYAELAKGE